jgi:hypothetical protein
MAACFVKVIIRPATILLRQFLQRHLRPRADMLDHFGRRQRP